MLERCKPVASGEFLQQMSRQIQAGEKPAPVILIVNFILLYALPLAIWAGAILPWFFADRVPRWSWFCVACIAYLLFRYVLEYRKRTRRGNWSNANASNWEKFKVVNKAIRLEDTMRRAEIAAKAGNDETAVAHARHVYEGLGFSPSEALASAQEKVFFTMRLCGHEPATHCLSSQSASEPARKTA